MPIEIVDLPINSMVIFHSHVSLPEGKHGCLMGNGVESEIMGMVIIMFIQ